MTTPAEPVDPAIQERLHALAAGVRAASRSLRVVPLDEIWAGTEEEYLRASALETMAGRDDIALIRDSGRVYLFSELSMTRPYAEACAQSQCDDKRHVIAETVRAESQAYPRPTSLAAFCEPPFLLSAETVAAAIAAVAGDPNFADIQQVSASDGTPFLFSSKHLTLAHARSLAEWIAVEREQNW
jgi:hypothetical protein